MKEHQDACKRGDEKVSAIAEHAWQQHRPIKWEEVRVVDRASKNCELKIKEALHIQMTPDNKFNRDIGLEFPCPCCVHITLQDIINSKHTLQKSCCLHCVITSPWRVRPRLTPEEDFGKKSKHRIGCQNKTTCYY